MLIDAQADMVVVAQARSGREAVRMCCAIAPDVAVLDVSMPDMDGAEATQTICTQCPGAKVVALTRHSEQGYLRRMLGAGAVGYVLKRTAADALIQAIRTVASGGTYIDQSIMGSLVPQVIGKPSESHEAPGAASTHLSDREEQVLRAVAWGLSSKEVAARLGLSVKTVESYKASALLKLGIRTRSEILRYALAENWLEVDTSPD